MIPPLRRTTLVIWSRPDDHANDLMVVLRRLLTMSADPRVVFRTRSVIAEHPRYVAGYDLSMFEQEP